jgi:hypothetical protein
VELLDENPEQCCDDEGNGVASTTSTLKCISLAPSSVEELAIAYTLIYSLGHVVYIAMHVMGVKRG